MGTKIIRKQQKVFGSTATANQIAKFGSLAAGSPSRTDGPSADPDVIQSLSNFLDGWFQAVMGPNSPAIEDMNALCFLFSRQLAYVLQTGIPEWLSTTEYFIGSVVQDGTGLSYISIANNNLGNAVTDQTKWKIFGAKKFQTITSAGAVNASTDVADLGGAGSYTATFPAANTVPGKEFTARYPVGASGVKTISPAIDGVTVTLDTERQFFKFISNGTIYVQVG